MNLLEQDRHVWDRDPKYDAAKSFVMEAELRHELYSLVGQWRRQIITAWSYERLMDLVTAIHDERLDHIIVDWFGDKLKHDFDFDHFNLPQELIRR